MLHELRKAVTLPQENMRNTDLLCDVSPFQPFCFSEHFSVSECRPEYFCFSEHLLVPVHVPGSSHTTWIPALSMIILIAMETCLRFWRTQTSRWPILRHSSEVMEFHARPASCYIVDSRGNFYSFGFWDPFYSSALISPNMCNILLVLGRINSVPGTWHTIATVMHCILLVLPTITV